LHHNNRSGARLRFFSPNCVSCLNSGVVLIKFAENTLSLFGRIIKSNNMNKSYILIALAMVAALSTVSCKCSSNKTEQQEPTPEDVQEMKQVLADSVLAEIDALAEQYIDISSKSFRIKTMELTDEEKLVKPDYLLDPANANKFVTKSQKVNALAIYAMEMGLREIYEMPMEDTKAAIAQLAAEVNFPFELDKQDADVPLSELIKAEYAKCKDNGDLALFWQFQNAILCEISYILAQNPDLLFSRIPEKQWKNYCQRRSINKKAMIELAKYDAEMATLFEFLTNVRVIKSDEEWAEVNSSLESAKQIRIANKDKYIARRNALLQ